MVDGKRENMAMSGGQWAVVILLFTLTLLNYMDRQILSILVPVLRTKIGLTPAEYAGAINGFLLAYALMYTGSGLVLDRIGVRVGLAIFVTAWSLVSALHALIYGFWGLVLLRVLLGAFEPGGWTGGVKAVAERFTAGQRGIATGIFSSGSSVATAITPPLVVFLSLRFGWRSAFALPSAIGLLWVPFWLRSSKQPTVTGGQRSTPGVTPSEFKLLLGNRRVLAYMMARFFGDSLGYFFLFWLPDYLVSTKHFSFAMLGALGWIPYLINDLAPLAGGYASGRLVQAGRPAVFSRKLVMTVGAIFVAGGALFQTSMQVWAILFSLSASTFGVGVWAGNLHALPGDAFPNRIVATVYGLAGSAGAVGGVVFNSMVGHFSAHGSYSTVFLLLALLEPLGVTALWVWLRDEDESRLEQEQTVIPGVGKGYTESVVSNQGTKDTYC
jgi:MFS transporter, ACS family, hexuronate transporter